MSQYAKKMWAPQGFFADHRMVFRHLPRIAGAYIGPNAVDPELNEAVMVTVNSVNSCPYCKGLHGQLARMAGVDDPDQLMAATSIAECTKVIDDPAIVYARTFAEQDGRGDVEEQAFHKLADATHVGFARSVRALCWFLLWGSIGGNTLNGFFARLAGRPKKGSSVLFELLFTAYYGLLFLVIAGVNTVLKLSLVCLNGSQPFLVLYSQSLLAPGYRFQVYSPSLFQQNHASYLTDRRSRTVLRYSHRHSNDPT